MPLPVSRTALDRLGSRLAANDPIEEADLAELALVLAAYQEILDQVKAKLSDLGYAATTRVKTTGTLVDKLRRETARLSQVQDLAGARIVVPGRAAQDSAVETIRADLEASGYSCKIIDRRKNPSHGYRAVHLIVQMDRVPVEVQVRTDLQDTWAQIMERLADRWGRGIRYGDDPEDPDARVRTERGIASRRQVIETLVQFSEAIAKVELIKAKIDVGLAHAKALARVVEESRDLPGETLATQMPPPMRASIAQLRDSMAELPEDSAWAIPDWEAFLPQHREVTLGDVLVVMRTLKEALESNLNEVAERLSEPEHQVRDTLQLIADASDE